MIANILFYVLIPIVILIGLIGLLYWLLIGRYPNESLNDPDDDNYFDDDDDFGDDDDDDYEYFSLLDEPLSVEPIIWPNDESEYTVEHARKLTAMEADVIAFMIRQDLEVQEYLSQMAA